MRLIAVAAVAALAAAATGCGIAGRALTGQQPAGQVVAPQIPGGCLPGGQSRPADANARIWAESAWRYVETNTNPATGIVNATAGRPLASMWDAADAIAAVYAAYEFGFIDSCAFDQRFGRIVAFLNAMPLVDNIAPNRWYNTDRPVMVGADNQPAVVGWSSADLGRLLIWLRIAEARHPSWSEYVGRAVARWNFCAIVSPQGFLRGGVHTGPDANTLARDAGLGYEEYAAAGFSLWGWDLSQAAALDPSEPVTIEGVDLRRDARELRSGGAMAPLTTTPFAAFEMELAGRVNGDWRGYRDLGTAVSRAQYERYRRTRSMTARTFRPLATAPWSVYDTVWAEGYAWHTVDARGAAVPNLAMVSTAAVFELWAAYPDDVASRLVAFAAGLRDGDGGWYAGRLERSGAADMTLALRTNAAVLEALLFRQSGVILPPAREPGWFELNSRDEFFRPGRCLPGEPRRDAGAQPAVRRVPAATVHAWPGPVGAAGFKRVRLAMPVQAFAPVSRMRFAQAPATEAVSQPQPRGFSLTPAIDVPLTTEDAAGSGSEAQGEQTSRSPRVALTLRYAPRQTFFARITAYKYFDESRKTPWNPDFTYSFGYDNWRPGTVALTYDNYNGNRFNPNRDEGARVTRVEEGSMTASYKIPIPLAVERVFVPAPDNRISASVSVHVTPRFNQEESLERGEWKRSVSLGVRNRFYRWFFAEARAYYYPLASQQQPWDPDFTYGFGYFDWHPGTVSVQYANYAGNRFPGHKRPGGGSFADGGISIAITRAW